MAKKQKLTTKIIGGKYRGKVLELPSLDTTRSTKSILKESFFNVLQFDIIDKVFIEAFGGSGSIGLEAISRGASQAYFCEIDRRSYKSLDKNCQSVEPESCNILFGDTFEKLPQVLESLKESDKEIIVYIDPPFDYRDGMEGIYDKCFDMVKNIKNENIALIVFEHYTDEKIPETLGSFKQFKSKKFGKSSLTYLQSN
jgi:16S rRNA (guanine(966)-N(2))-methyltransferase RsmD